MYLRRGAGQVCRHAHPGILSQPQRLPLTCFLVHTAQAWRVIHQAKRHNVALRQQTAAFHASVGVLQSSEDVLAAYRKTCKLFLESLFGNMFLTTMP